MAMSLRLALAAAALPLAAGVDIEVLGSEWFHADAKFSVNSSSDGVEWDFEHNHLENEGIVTHFPAVELKAGESYTVKFQWNSDQDTKWSKSCSSKYWTESKYDHACVDGDKIAKGCSETIRCPVNTGDFRFVIADSRGAKVTKSGFQSLDNSNVSGTWEGFHIRMMPHVTTSFKRRSLIFPNTVWMKNPDETKNPGIFAHSSTEKQVEEMRDQADTGGFGVAPGDTAPFSLVISRKDESDFELEVTMGSHSYKTTWKFPAGHAPEQLDTLAIAQPNLRAYSHLKLTKASAVTTSASSRNEAVVVV